MSRRLIRYFALMDFPPSPLFKGVHRVVLRLHPNHPVYAHFPDGTRSWVSSAYNFTEKSLSSRGFFKTQREALLHAQTKLKSHTRRLQKWRKENREHLAAVKELLGECK